MLKVKDVRVVEKESKKSPGKSYKVVEVEFANGYVFQSNLNKGYVTPDAEFCINLNKQ